MLHLFHPLIQRVQTQALWLTEPVRLRAYVGEKKKFVKLVAKFHVGENVKGAVALSHDADGLLLRHRPNA